MDEGWFSAQLIEEPDPAEARKAVDTDLERGTSAVWVRVDPDAVPADKLAEVLSDVLFDLAPTHVSSNTDELAAAEALAAAFAASGKENIRGSLGIDPIGFAALNGTTPRPLGDREGRGACKAVPGRASHRRGRLPLRFHGRR